MVILQEIDENNFYQVINLEVEENQKEFVAPNVRSLAECYLYRDENDVFPYAIIKDETVIGFVLVYTDDDKKNATIWRIMMDKNYQNKGYGRDAMLEAEKLLQQSEKYDYIYTSYRKDNFAAKKLYSSLGYLEDRINEYNEVVVKKKV